MENSSEKAAYCTLGRIFGFEPSVGMRLVEAAGSAEALFAMDARELDSMLGPYCRFRSQISGEELERSAEELERLHSRGVIFVTAAEQGYPPLLRECPDAPLGLYVRSCSEPEEIFCTRPSVSVVGTRDMSMYGKEWCRRIVEALAGCRNSPTIVSGLAIGIDITAHCAALELGLPTVAVLPTYITEVYPSRHREWAERIACTPGCALVSDYPPGVAPQPVNFLRRNRIIAGLSHATVLVESRSKGGGLITANLAFDYSREVFALPGRADDIRSQGCNRLIRAKVAEPIDDLEAFAASTGLGTFTRRNRRILKEEIEKVYGARVTGGELALIADVAQAVKANREIAVDDICALCGCSWTDAARITGMLQTDGFIEVDLFQRCSMKYRF